MSKCPKCNKVMSDHLISLDHMYQRTGHIAGLLTVYDDGDGVLSMICPDGTEFEHIMSMLNFAVVSLHRMRTTKPEPTQ